MSLVNIFKQGWHKMPDVVGSSFLALIGAAFGTVGVLNYYAKDGDNRRYKLDYTVYRDDDPRCKTIKQ